MVPVTGGATGAGRVNEGERQAQEYKEGENVK